MIPPGYVSIIKAYSELAEIHSVDAEGRLRYLLGEGKLQALYFDQRGEAHEFSSEYWKGLDKKIWQGILAGSPMVVGPDYSAKEHEAFNSESYSWQIDNIIVRENDLEVILNKRTNTPTIDPMTISPTSTRGRPPKFEWDAIWCGIVSGIDGWGKNPTQSDVISRVQDWFEESFPGLDVPSESILQPKISKMLQILNGTAPSVVFNDFAKQNPKTRKKQKKPAK